jgi:hypothetical protein
LWCATLAAVGLLTELNCGDLDAGVDGSVVWIVCDCGATMARQVDEGHELASYD